MSYQRFCCTPCGYCSDTLYGKLQRLTFLRASLTIILYVVSLNFTTIGRTLFARNIPTQWALSTCTFLLEPLTLHSETHALLLHNFHHFEIAVYVQAAVLPLQRYCRHSAQVVLILVDSGIPKKSKLSRINLHFRSMTASERDKLDA